MTLRPKTKKCLAQGDFENTEVVPKFNTRRNYL